MLLEINKNLCGFFRWVEAGVPVIARIWWLRIRFNLNWARSGIIRRICIGSSWAEASLIFLTFTPIIKAPTSWTIWTRNMRGNSGSSLASLAETPIIKTPASWIIWARNVRTNIGTSRSLSLSDIRLNIRRNSWTSKSLSLRWRLSDISLNIRRNFGTSSSLRWRLRDIRLRKFGVICTALRIINLWLFLPFHGNWRRLWWSLNSLPRNIWMR